MEMEENNSNTTRINSVGVEKLLQSNITYMDRKRKLQAEELGLPPPKHKSLIRDFGSEEYDYSSDADSGTEGIDRCESGEESAKDSNSIVADADSTISVSNDADVGPDQGYLKHYSCDQPFASSADWGGNCSKYVTNNSSESRSVMKSGSTTLESPSIGKEQDFPHPNIGPHSSMNFEERIQGFGGHVNCNCSECTTSFEDCTDKELEEMLYSNGVSPNNYVLSSGRWTVNQDAQQGAKKLTIDKEFEQYFSTLML